jgi:hypothetical protein
MGNEMGMTLCEWPARPARYYYPRHARRRRPWPARAGMALFAVLAVTAGWAL